MKLPKLSLHNLVLVLLVVFIVSDVSVPNEVSKFVNTLHGSALLLLVCLYVLYTSPVLGVVTLVAVFELLRRTGGLRTAQDFIPSEEKKSEEFEVINDFPVTLEEEVVANMVPMTNEKLSAPSYQPLLQDVHHSSQV